MNLWLERILKVGITVLWFYFIVMLWQWSQHNYEEINATCQARGRIAVVDRSRGWICVLPEEIP